MGETIDVGIEVAGRRYKKLIHFLVSNSTSFSLVIRPENPIDEPGRTLLGELEVFLLRKEETDRWPGTIVLGKVTVLFYRCQAEVEELLTLPNSIYGWRQPDFPEDLAFYRNEENWFGSTAHEQDAFFIPGHFSIEEIRKNVPGIKIGQRSYD